jgi:four helix bundle protein
MLRILDDIVLTVGNIHGLSRVIGRQDPDLCKQLKRAANSVGLNAGEGLHARGGNRTVRIESAMNSAREVMMGIRIAGAAGYIAPERVATEVDALDRIVATLWKLAYRAR